MGTDGKLVAPGTFQHLPVGDGDGKCHAPGGEAPTIEREDFASDGGRSINASDFSSGSSCSSTEPDDPLSRRWEEWRLRKAKHKGRKPPVLCQERFNVPVWAVRDSCREMRHLTAIRLPAPILTSSFQPPDQFSQRSSHERIWDYDETLSPTRTHRHRW